MIFTWWKGVSIVLVALFGWICGCHLASKTKSPSLSGNLPYNNLIGHTDFYRFIFVDVYAVFYICLLCNYNTSIVKLFVPLYYFSIHSLEYMLWFVCSFRFLWSYSGHCQVTSFPKNILCHITSLLTLWTTVRLELLIVDSWSIFRCRTLQDCDTTVVSSIFWSRRSHCVVVLVLV